MPEKHDDGKPRLVDGFEENWEQMTSQLFSAELPSFAFLISTIDDLQLLLEDSIDEVEKLGRDKNRSPGGLLNTMIPMRGKEYLSAFTRSLGCMYLLSVIGQRWEELDT